MILTLKEARAKAMADKSVIVCMVMMANDDIRKLRIGPRGGWRFVK